jgi:hypothetical protein
MRHVQTAHREEPLVKHYTAAVKNKSTEDVKRYAKLTRNHGDFLYNLKILQVGEENSASDLVLARCVSNE